MYAEELLEHLHNEQLNNWRQGGKKGAPPIHWRELIAIEEQRERDRKLTESSKDTETVSPLPDIFDLGLL